MDNIDLLIKKFDDFAKETKKELETIKRGVYGDPANGFLGLIERQESDEERIDKIEKRQWKNTVLIGGAVIAFDFIWNLIKTNFVK